MQSVLSANSEALATVTGIVDGTGSVGAAIGQVRMNPTVRYFRMIWIRITDPRLNPKVTGSSKKINR